MCIYYSLYTGKLKAYSNRTDMSIIRGCYEQTVKSLFHSFIVILQSNLKILTMYFSVLNESCKRSSFKYQQSFVIAFEKNSALSYLSRPENLGLFLLVIFCFFLKYLSFIFDNSDTIKRLWHAIYAGF